MPKLKRHFRFSLSTLLVLTTILCLFLGVKVRQLRLQRLATTWVLDHGGTIVYERQVMDQPHVSRPDVGPPGPKWLRAVIGDDYFDTPYGIQFLRDPVGDISQLRSFPTLRTLAIYGDEVDDITPLAELRELEALGLRCHSDCDLSPLKGLEKLRILVVCGASYQQIEGLKKDMPHCEITTTIVPQLLY